MSGGNNNVTMELGSITMRKVITEKPTRIRG
jgi:hypothetical protein